MLGPDEQDHVSFLSPGNARVNCAQLVGVALLQPALAGTLDNAVDLALSLGALLWEVLWHLQLLPQEPGMLQDLLHSYPLQGQDSR